MKKICALMMVGLCLCLSSCSWLWTISIRFYNETSMPVNVSYMYFMASDSNKSTHLHDLDTVYHKIDAGKKLKVRFSGYHTKSFVKDSSYCEFIRFETPTKSVCYRDSDEICDFYRSAKLSRYNLWGVARGKFIITDSLFNSKK